MIAFLLDPHFSAGLVAGIVLTLALLYFARGWALSHVTHREARAYHRGRAELVAEQAGSHVHCEPGPPA